ncbi:MAG: ATP-binding protein [Steroidobacteraceae bacterium]|nr:ATP-binding protein [Steroidobacteraceae bacterium]
MDELQEIHERLLRFSPDALIVVDEHAQIRFANDTVRDLFGHDPESLIGKRLDMLIPERLRGRHEDHIRSYMRDPDNRDMGTRISDLHALRADGVEFYAGIRLAPFRLGEKLFVAAAIRDMTERQRINEELVAAREEADRANRAKSRFLAMASHDLRQPMQTICLLNAALLRVVPQPDAGELLRQQEQAIASVTRLLDTLLDISRLESGAVQPQKTDAPLAEMFEELRSEFSSLAHTREIDLHMEPTNLVLSTDRILFRQLMQNLLGNALKYTEHGSVRVCCSLQAEDVIVTVEDTGIGIPADKLERIFDEYYQVDTHGTKRMGVGLGLAIVKEVARVLGYSVSIDSALGKGTQAQVRIPRQHLVRADLQRTDADAAAPCGADARKARVILVEDNDGVRLATELFLKFEGHETLSAPSVAEAHKLFDKARRGDILIADYRLDARHTGLDLLMSLRERLGSSAPGIIMSGDLPTVLRAMNEPVADCRFLSKPVDTRVLLEAIEELSVASS